MPTFTVKLNSRADSCGMTQIIVIMEEEEIADGFYHPVAIACSPDEAKELAESHYNNADRDEDVAPFSYQLFARDGRGNYVNVGEIQIS
jgi:hypothetical protein